MARRRNQLEPKTKKTVISEPLPDFHEAVNLFLRNEKAKNRLKRTIAWHRENFKAFEKAMTEQNITIELDKITPRLITNNLILYLLETKGNKPQTINMRLRSMNQLYKFLIKEEIFDDNPFAKVDKLKPAETVIKALSDDQIKRLLNAADQKTFVGLRDYTMMNLLLDTGIRLSEMAGLRLGDLNFRESNIKIRGKGARERLVPFQGRLKKIMKNYLLHRGSDIDHDMVFVTIDNNPITRRSIQERLEIITQKANLKGVQTSPHRWRNTFARLYIMNGGDPFSLKTILGHKSWQMTHHYVQLFGTDINAQHKKASPLGHLGDENDF